MTEEHERCDDCDELDEPCAKCGCKLIHSTECNDDDPDADVHQIYYCAACGYER